jgi:hypothetical protein
MTNLRPCKFAFDMDEDILFDGYIVGGTWNGFDNVKVTLAVAQDMDRRCPYGPTDEDDRWADLPIGNDGLINLSGGYTTRIISD